MKKFDWGYVGIAVFVSLMVFYFLWNAVVAYESYRTCYYYDSPGGKYSSNGPPIVRGTHYHVETREQGVIGLNIDNTKVRRNICE